MSNAELVLRQARFENKAFWRNPAAAFFTFAFPLLFLVIFSTLLGGGTSPSPTGEEIESTTYFIPAILSFSVVTACFTNIAISISFSRDEGILKRLRGTPCPGWVYLAARVLHAIFVSTILVVIVLLFGQSSTGWTFHSTLCRPFSSRSSSGPGLSARWVGRDLRCPQRRGRSRGGERHGAATAVFLGNLLSDRGRTGMGQDLRRDLPHQALPRRDLRVVPAPPDNPSGFLWTSVVVIALWGVGGSSSGSVLPLGTKR